jgi:hypothetical protein
MMTMVPSELTFLEVKKEFIFADAVEFEESMLSEAPKGFDAVDKVLAAGKFVFVVMDTMMAKTARHQAIVSFPAVGVNVALGEHISSEDRHQFLPGAVGNDTHEHLISSFVKAQDRNLASRSTASFSSHPPGSEVAFIHLDVPSKRFHFQ